MFFRTLCFFFLFITYIGQSSAQASEPYQLLPGDELYVSVWQEDRLNLDVIVLPDGSITLPLVGRIVVAGNSTIDVEQMILEKLTKYLSDPVISVSVKAVSGNQVFVLGKVINPGVYILRAKTTVPQILSMAGGLDRFADEGNIKILKNQGSNPEYVSFDYNDLENGDNGDQVNIFLEAGDVVIIP